MKFKRILISVIVTTLVVCGVALSNYFPDIIVTSPDGIWTDTRAYTTLDNALDAIGTNHRDIYIVRQETVTTLTIPSNAHLHFAAFGSINVSTQLTINTSDVDAPSKHIFYGAGELDFARGSVLKSSWFADLPDMFDKTVDNYVTVVIDSGWSANVDADCAVGDNVTLRWDGPGNLIVVNSGFTLSNVGNISAGKHQIFGGSGNIRFNNGTVLKSSWFNDIAKAVTLIDTAYVDLEVTEPITLDENITIPSNLSIKALPGNTIIGAYTLAINGPIEAGNYQIFGANTIVRLGDAVDNANAGWFGLVNDGATDNTTALQNAINATSWGAGKLSIPPGIYLYTTLRVYYHVTDNPNFINHGSGIPLSINGAGSINGSMFRYTAYDSTEYRGTVLRSTNVSGDCFIIGIGTPYADRVHAGQIKVSNITFFGETTDRIVSVGYAQEGFSMEDCFIGMKADIVGTGLHINNAWGSTYKNVWVYSKTDAADVESYQSTGIDLDVYDEGYVSYLSGGNFLFENVSVNNFYYGWDLAAFNTTLINCNDYRCAYGVRVRDGIGYQFTNHYGEYASLYGFVFSSGADITISGGYLDLTYATVAGVRIGNLGDTGNVFNVLIDTLYLSSINQAGASGILRYGDARKITVKNCYAQMYDDPFIETSISVDDRIKLSDIEYIADPSGAWTYDDTKIVYDNTGALADYRHHVDFGPDPRRGSASAIYDFSVDTGAIDTYVLGKLPDNATITEAWYEVITQPTSGGAATLQAGVSTNDPQGLIANTAYNDAIFNTGYHDCLTDGTAANFTTKTTGHRNVCFVIAGATLTAGKIYFYWEWLESE